MAQFIPNDKFFSDRGHVWMSEGLTPIFGFEKNPSPHIALPLGFYHAEARASFVIEQGTFLSQQEGMLIPANGGIANTVTYTQKDVDGGVLSDFGVKVNYGDTKVFAANKPLGITYWDYLQSSFTLPNGFQTHLSQMLPTIVTEGVFMVPVVYMTDAAIAADATLGAIAADAKAVRNGLYGFGVGDLVAPDSIRDSAHAIVAKRLVPTVRTGGVRKFLEAPITVSSAAKTAGFFDYAADSIAQVTGRVMTIVDDFDYPTQMLNMSKTDGVEVQGDGTHGFDRALWNAFKNTLTDATKKSKYLRKVMLVNVNK